VDALAGALLGRVDHFQAQAGRHAGAHAGGLQQLTAGVLDVGEAVDVELEHLGRILHTQPVTGAQVLIHPDPKFVRTGLRRH
jgi:hypothetical protein